MSEMTKDEIRNFLLQGTFTGKLGTINKNGIPHVVPIWYTLDEEDNLIFNTGKNSVKAIAEIISNADQKELFKWAKIIAVRYMGNDKAEEYGKRNSSEGELLIKIKPTKVIGQKDIAGW
jgi:hypothetical protein